MDSEDLQVAAETNATERVAFDLMDKIANEEALPKNSPRRYYLELYSQCLYVVKTGGMPEGIKEHPQRQAKKAARKRPRHRGLRPPNKANSASVPADLRATDLQVRAR
jgi:hypothetical protein